MGVHHSLVHADQHIHIHIHDSNWIEFDFVFLSPLAYSAKNTYRENSPSSHLREETHLNRAHGSNESLMGRRRTFGSILDAKSVQVFKEKREIFYLLSFILHNTKPVGHQV